MREFLNQALSEAFGNLDKQTPKTKKAVAYIDIDDIKPTDIGKYQYLITDNDIPEHAYFGVDCNEHACICYNYDVPTTKKERLEYKRKVFHDRVFPKLYKLLTANGYKRIGFKSEFFKEFNNLNVYDSYINGEIDILEKYYSIFFHR